MPEHNLVNQPARVTSLIIPLCQQPIGEASHAAVIPHLAGKPIGKCYSTGKGLALSLLMLILPHLLSFPLPLQRAYAHTCTYIHREHSRGKTTTHSKNPFLSIRLLAVIHLRTSCWFWRLIFLFSNFSGRKKLPLLSHWSFALIVVTVGS